MKAKKFVGSYSGGKDSTLALYRAIKMGMVPMELITSLADEIEKSGAYICGENGEYHTFAFDVPLFANPVEFEVGEILRLDNFTVVPLIP